MNYTKISVNMIALVLTMAMFFGIVSVKGEGEKVNVQMRVLQEK